MSSPTPRTRRAAVAALVLSAALLLGGPAQAQEPDRLPLADPAPAVPAAPSAPSVGTSGDLPAPDGPEAQFNLDLGDTLDEPSQSLTIIVLLTLLALAPSLLIMMTAFTRIVIVLSITRNAIGLPSVPPNQVVVGLSLFLTFFVMGPTLAEVNEVGVQPLLEGELGYGEAAQAAQVPLREFMLDQVGESELALFVDASGDQPVGPDDVAFTALVPAFVLSELKAAMIIGFIVFVPFLVIDLIASSVLMSMGMMMLPPVLVSLPFKLLLFVLVDGWALVVGSLLNSFV